MLKIMEEKKYRFKEQKGEGMVCEPAPAYRSAVAEPSVRSSNRRVKNVESYDSIRMGHSLEEVREHLMQFEERRKDPSLWSTWEEVNVRLHQKHPWLK